MKRFLITADEAVALIPAAKRIPKEELELLCLDVTSQIEAWAGQRFFKGLREVDVYSTGSNLAELPDPPIRSIIEVKLNGEGDALDLASFKIEDPAGGVLWYDSGFGGTGSDLDRSLAQGFPGGAASAGSPQFWRVVYDSGLGASVGEIRGSAASPFAILAGGNVLTVTLDGIAYIVTLTLGAARTAAEVSAEISALIEQAGAANAIASPAGTVLRIVSGTLGAQSSVIVTASAAATVLGLDALIHIGSEAPSRVRWLARELLALKLERINRQGVTSESVSQVSRSFDFDKAEKSLRARARSMGGRVAIR